MGLPKAALRFIAIEQHRKPFSGSAVTLGRQCVYATFSDVQRILSEEGIRPASLPSGLDIVTNIPTWKGTALERYTSDVAFFHALGVQDIQALDVDRFEGAEILWDLNKPIGSEMVSRFDLIVDSGTIEHVFDVRTAMMNLVRMLRPGGRIVHFTPANNFCNHGFFQFSPTFFADYYAVNQFCDVRVFVAEESLRREQTERLDLFEFKTRNQPCMMASPTDKRLLVFCVAEKGIASTEDRVPMQSYYSTVFAASDQSAESQRTAEEQHIPSMRAAQMAKRWLPSAVYLALRSCWTRARRLFFGATEIRKPWGLRFWKRLE